MFKPEYYIKAWTEMNPELEKEDPGIRLSIPSLERTQKWIDESKRAKPNHDPTTGQCG